MSKAKPKDHAAGLISRFTKRDATVAVIGLGYVGLPTVRAMHDAGFRVVGYDIDAGKIKMLRAGKGYLSHLGPELFKQLAKSPRFKPTADPADLAEADALILCVPTPLGAHHEPDLSFVERSTEMVARTLRRGQLVVLTSTSYPGTTRQVCLPILERGGERDGKRGGLRCGTDFFLAFSPEREDPGRKGVETRTIPRLLGGVDSKSSQVALSLFAGAIEKVIPVETAEIAEAAKLLENIYRSVNIALVNELKPVLASMGIDIWKVIEAAASKPFGFQPFKPGPGLGGHCIPIDPYYLTWKAREHGQVTRFIELAGEINSRMPHRVVESVAAALNQDGKAVKGARVLVIGIAYKPDIDDIRETPAAEIISLLLEQGAEVSYHDPHVPEFPAMRRYDIELQSRALTAKSLGAADCVLIVTDHSAVDWALIGRAARLVVDTRNAMAKVKGVKARIDKA